MKLYIIVFITVIVKANCHLHKLHDAIVNTGAQVHGSINKLASVATGGLASAFNFGFGGHVKVNHGVNAAQEPNRNQQPLRPNGYAPYYNGMPNEPRPHPGHGYGRPPYHGGQNAHYNNPHINGFPPPHNNNHYGPPHGHQNFPHQQPGFNQNYNPNPQYYPQNNNNFNQHGHHQLQPNQNYYGNPNQNAGASNQPNTNEDKPVTLKPNLPDTYQPKPIINSDTNNSGISTAPVTNKPTTKNPNDNTDLFVALNKNDKDKKENIPSGDDEEFELDIRMKD